MVTVRVSRRIFLSALGIVGVVACSPAAPVTAPSGSGAQAPGAPAAATGTAPKPAASGTQAPAASSKPGAGEPRYGGTLRAGIQVEPEILTGNSGDNGAFLYLYKFFEPWIEFGPNNTLLPRLAESWEVVNPTTYLFKMRQGVKFHDGSPMTIEDVKFSLDNQRDPTKSRSATLLATVDSVEIKSPSSVQVTLKQPFAPLLINLATPASIVFPQALYTKADKSFATKPVGTGPYKFVEWVKGDRLKVERFDGYWGNRPYADAIEFRLVPDENVKLVNLRTGNLDVVDSLPPKDVKPLEADPNFTVLSPPRFGYRCLRMHMQKEPFTNKALRQAVQLAIDPAPMVKSIMFDTVQIAYGPIGLDMVGYDPAFKGVTPDLAKAKQKLAEGGQPNGFSFTITVPNVPTDIQLAQAIAAQLETVGIKMAIEQIDRGTYNARLQRKELVAGLSGNLSGRAEADASLSLYFRSTSASNFNGYANPAVDDLLVKAQAEPDRDKRAAIYRQIQQAVVEDAAEAYLFTPYQAINVATSKKVVGFQPYDSYLNFGNTWLRE